MPPLPDVPQVLRVRLLFDIGGKPNQGIRFFAQYTGAAPSPTDAVGFAGNILATAAGSFAAYMHPDNAVTGCIVEDLTTPMGAVGEHFATTVGTELGGPLPAEAAFVTQYVVPKRYRGGHPRSSWPLGTDADIDTPQAWLPGSVTNFQLAVVTFFSNVVGEVVGSTTISAHVAVQYYHGFTVVTSPTTGRARNVPNILGVPDVLGVTAIVGKSGVGSARRRRLKGSA